MDKGIIYYTDNRLDESIFLIVHDQIMKAGLPITSCSHAALNFGYNAVICGERSYLTMMKQIINCLMRSVTKFVFFCEHDVLYPKSHFEFTPSKDNVFYYNDNVWRWDYPTNVAISYDRLISLSSMCANREFVLEHYRKRMESVNKYGLNNGRDPGWARKWGYEPGTKKIKRGGFSDDDFETWQSEYPIVDIRHSNTFSPKKVSIESFKHKPIAWKETTIDRIPGWNLACLFPQETRCSSKKLLKTS